MKSEVRYSFNDDTVRATLTWRRDPDVEAACENDSELAYHRALRMVFAAESQLDVAVRARVTKLVRDKYPTAAALKYDGEHNEDGLLRMYVRQILDADSNVLDSQDDPNDNWAWVELIDGDVEPLLWDVCERDESYYGDDKVYELNEAGDG